MNEILDGKQLNGVGQNNAYGDDYQGDTDFPLVRFSNTSTGNVYWGRDALREDALDRSRNHHVKKFDVPASIPSGKDKLNVVPSGIASNTIV